jgi:hypothetical protein
MHTQKKPLFYLNHNSSLPINPGPESGKANNPTFLVLVRIKGDKISESILKAIKMMSHINHHLPFNRITMNVI